MAKARRKPTTRKVTRSVRSSDNSGLLFADKNGPWGKDQPMVLIMAAGIIIFIVVALFLTGWL